MHGLGLPSEWRRSNEIEKPGSTVDSALVVESIPHLSAIVTEITRKPVYVVSFDVRVCPTPFTFHRTYGS